MEYVVQKGDTLGTIAAKFLGASSRYKEIAVVNPQLEDINYLEIGQKLNVPDKFLPALVSAASSSSASVPTESFMMKLLQNKRLLVFLALSVVTLFYVKTKKKKAIA